MICPGCGKNIFDGDAVCPYCGFSRSGRPQNYNAQQNPGGGFNNQQFAVFNAGAPAQQQPQQVVRTKTSPAIVALIAVLSVMLLASCFVLFIKPGYLIRVETLPAATETTAAAAAQTTAPQSEPPQTTTTEEKIHRQSTKPMLTDLHGLSGDGGHDEKPSVTTTAAPKKETTPTTTTAAKDDHLEEDNRAYAEAMAYSTDQRPSHDDFYWIYGQAGLIYAPLPGTETLTNPLSWSGGWKCLVIINPTNSAGYYTRSLCNATLGVYNSAVDCTIDWYVTEADNSERTYDENPDTFLFGDVNNGGFTAEGEQLFLSMQYFFTDGEKQYALGTINTHDGLQAYAAFVRP